jgi:hypothetical protein
MQVLMVNYKYNFRNTPSISECMSFPTSLQKLRKQCYYPFTLHPNTYLSRLFIVLFKATGAMATLRDWLGEDLP